VEARKREKLEKKADQIKSKSKPILIPSIKQTLRGVTISITDSIVKPTETPLNRVVTTRAPETTTSLSTIKIETTTIPTTSSLDIVVTPVPTAFEPTTFTPEPTQAELEKYLDKEEKSTIENTSPIIASTVMPTTAPVTSKLTVPTTKMENTGSAKEASFTGSIPETWFGKKMVETKNSGDTDNNQLSFLDEKQLMWLGVGSGITLTVTLAAVLLWFLAWRRRRVLRQACMHTNEEERLEGGNSMAMVQVSFNCNLKTGISVSN
jgi:hypothetical protein